MKGVFSIDGNVLRRRRWLTPQVSDGGGHTKLVVFIYPPQSEQVLTAPPKEHNTHLDSSLILLALSDESTRVQVILRSMQHVPTKKSDNKLMLPLLLVFLIIALDQSSILSCVSKSTSLIIAKSNTKSITFLDNILVKKFGF